MAKSPGMGKVPAIKESRKSGKKNCCKKRAKAGETIRIPASGAPNPEDYPGSELVDWSAGDAVNAFQSSDDDLAFLRGTASSCSNFDEVTLQEVFGPVERPN